MKRTLNFCHWNLNPVLAHNKIKISLLEAYDSVYHNDIIALTETQLNQGISDDEILINGFSGKQMIQVVIGVTVFAFTLKKTYL